MDKVRVLRVIEYVGEREWVESTLKNSITGQKDFGKGIIKSAIIDSFPEIIEQKEVMIKDCSNCEHSWYHWSSTNSEIVCKLDSSDREECQSDNFKYYIQKTK